MPLRLLWVLGLTCALGAVAEPNSQARWHRFFTDTRLAAVERQYGDSGRTRVAEFYQWLQQQRTTEMVSTARLEQVNRYLNQLQFVADQQHWQRADYWATPVEMVASGGGDCEDFAIAKYFVLRVLGVPSEQLRLMYVKSLTLNQAHMVLLYLPSPNAMPLVLDNLDEEIKAGAERPDLVPVYSFNAEGLWRARAFDQGQQLKAGENGVELWGELLQRMDKEEHG